MNRFVVQTSLGWRFHFSQPEATWLILHVDSDFLLLLETDRLRGLNAPWGLRAALSLGRVASALCCRWGQPRPRTHGSVVRGARSQTQEGRVGGQPEVILGPDS